MQNPIFWTNLTLVCSGDNEVIVVDGGSHDGTVERLLKLGLKPILLPQTHRGVRYNRGIKLCKGEMILLVHPRTMLSIEALTQLQTLIGKTVWGAFSHSFDEPHPVLRFTSWYSNHVRGGMSGIYYLDHCLFFSKDLKESAEFPDAEIFEDTLFCRQLRRQLRPVRLPARVVTSAIRFRKNGLVRQALLNQVLKVMFLLGASQDWMNRVYERGLSLNMKK